MIFDTRNPFKAPKDLARPSQGDHYSILVMLGDSSTLTKASLLSMERQKQACITTSVAVKQIPQAQLQEINSTNILSAANPKTVTNGNLLKCIRFCHCNNLSTTQVSSKPTPRRLSQLKPIPRMWYQLYCQAQRKQAVSPDTSSRSMEAKTSKSNSQVKRYYKDKFNKTNKPENLTILFKFRNQYQFKLGHQKNGIVN